MRRIHCCRLCTESKYNYVIIGEFELPISKAKFYKLKLFFNDAYKHYPISVQKRMVKFWKCILYWISISRNTFLPINVVAKRKSKHILKRVPKFLKRRHKKKKWRTDQLFTIIVTENKSYVEWRTRPVAHADHKQLILDLRDTKKLDNKEKKKL